jgi:hypothetical protein
MKKPKAKALKFTAPKYDDLFGAVTQHGGEFHKGFWDMMIEAGFTKKQMAYRYTQLLLGINATNNQILKEANFKG